MTEEQVFLAALDLPDANARGVYLDEVCGTDTDLRRQVDALIDSHYRTGEFLERPAVEQLDSKTDSGCAVTIQGVTMPVAFPPGEDDSETLHFLTPSTRSDSLGRIGHYEVLQVLGKGGFGIVLRAFDDVLQRVVAIKVLAPMLAATSPARKRFLREAQSSAKVRHESVVQVYEVQEKPIPYLVMEYIPGETLQQRLDRQGPLAPAEVIQLGRQIAAGLAAAHETGLIHRDIKPGNILIEAGPNERVKITDFGLARTADDASLSQSGMVAGTPTYMAPEQARGDMLDHRADLFSLGSVFYTMIAGRPPFRAANTLAVLKRVTEEDPRPIREVIPEAPEWLCSIIAKLHAKNPDERFQTAREVADLLAQCETKLKAQQEIANVLPPTPASAPAPTTTAVTGEQGGGNPYLVAAVVLLLLPILALVGTELAGVTHLFFPKQATPDPVAKPGVPDSEGWVQLFNGKDLTGWKTPPEAPGHWEVKEGVLVGSLRRSNLFTERGDYANFHLRVEAKVNLGGDSGVFFRAAPNMRTDDGYEAEIHKNLTYARKTGTITAPQAEAGPIVLGLATDDSLTKPDEWFTLEIIAQGDSFITKVNGVETARCTDPANPRLRGHIGLQVWSPNTLVQFRKIEIKELPSSDAPPHSELAKRRFGSDEWIDVIPLIDPSLDKRNLPNVTGQNAWHIEQSELIVDRDALGSKLILPLDSDWPAFECELEFTRRAGNSGLNLNLPTKPGECPLVLDPAGAGGAYLGTKAKGVVLKEGAQLVTGQRATLRVVVNRQQAADQVSVELNGAKVGEWSGDLSSIAYLYKEGFPHDRRLSLWIQPGGNEFVFHRIRVRMLDGGNAETLRPVSAAPQVPEVSLPPFKNNLGMEFVVVPRGKAWLAGTKDRVGDEEVEIAEDFYLGKYEVTQGEWGQVMGTNPCHFTHSAHGNDHVKQFTNTELKRFPVEGVNWHDCQAFLAKLNEAERNTGWIYVLPTDVQWEYACRGGPMKTQQESAFDFYLNEPTNTITKELANFNIIPDRTTKVGSYPANRLGLHDMHGNVSEWCDDAVQFENQACRSTRGGCWANDEQLCLASRHYMALPDERSPLRGFRVARVRRTSTSEAEIQRIAALPAAEQVDAVRKELQRLNPGFDGAMTPTFEGDAVVGLIFLSDQIEDITPLSALKKLKHLACPGSYPNKGKLVDITPIAGLPLQVLTIDDTQVADLSALRGMQLTELRCARTPVSDLTPLQGMPMTFFGCGSTKVRDLTPLQGMKLETFEGQLLAITDLTPLRGMPLKNLDVFRSMEITDLRPLEGMPLVYLNLACLRASDLTPLRGMKKLEILILEQNAELKDLSPLAGLPIKELRFFDTGVTDLTPLAGMPLADVRFTPQRITRGFEVLRKSTSLQTIGINYENGWPAAEFWARYEKGEFGAAPQPPAPPEPEQIQELRRELIRLNPKFDGTLKHTLAGDVVTGLELFTDEVADISPLATLKGLTSLACRGSFPYGSKGKLADLSPLKGLQLTSLDLSQCSQVSDLSALQGMPLAQLNLTGTNVTDIAVLKEMPLAVLHLDRSPVADLSPLAGKAFTFLHVGGTKVKSLSDLPAARVDFLLCYPEQITSDADLDRLGVKGMDLWGVPATIDPARLRALQPRLSRVMGKPVDEFLKELEAAKPKPE